MLTMEMDVAKIQEEGYGARHAKNSIKASLLLMAREWHGGMLMRHFDKDATQRYHYTLRKGQGMSPSDKRFKDSYWGRKVSKGRDRPLFHSGEGMILAAIPNFKGTWKQARVVLPSKFNFRHSKSRVNMREEITKILPDEKAVLLAIGARGFRHALQKPPT